MSSDLLGDWGLEEIRPLLSSLANLEESDPKLSEGPTSLALAGLIGTSFGLTSTPRSILFGGARSDSLSGNLGVGV